jgi:hypothetical protein
VSGLEAGTFFGENNAIAIAEVFAQTNFLGNVEVFSNVFTKRTGQVLIRAETSAPFTYIYPGGNFGRLLAHTGFRIELFTLEGIPEASAGAELSEEDINGQHVYVETIDPFNPPIPTANLATYYAVLGGRFDGDAPNVRIVNGTGLTFGNPVQIIKKRTSDLTNPKGVYRFTNPGKILAIHANPITPNTRVFRVALASDLRQVSGWITPEIANYSHGHGQPPFSANFLLTQTDVPIFERTIDVSEFVGDKPFFFRINYGSHPVPQDSYPSEDAIGGGPRPPITMSLKITNI